MRGMYDGMVTIERRFTGMVNGTLIAEPGSRVHVTGMVNGRIINRGGSITGSGMVNG